MNWSQIMSSKLELVAKRFSSKMRPYITVPTSRKIVMLMHKICNNLRITNHGSYLLDQKKEASEVDLPMVIDVAISFG
jgi:hypothetical protein